MVLARFPYDQCYISPDFKFPRSPTLHFPGIMLNFPCPNYGIYPIICFTVFLSEFLLGSSKALEHHLCWNLPQLNAEAVKTFQVYIAVHPMGIDIKFKLKSCSPYKEVPLCTFSHKLYISVETKLYWDRAQFQRKAWNTRVGTLIVATLL